MAETKFDYNSVSSVYNQMKSINENIETLFTDIDKEMGNKMQVENEAVFGELGAQLLLDWDNISGCFPEFVQNFDNWSYLVASASGNYAQFEADVQAFKNANPLGVNSGGRTNSFISDSAFANALSQQELDDYASQVQFYQLTGATYIDTGMVSYLKKSDFWEGVELAMDAFVIFKGAKCAIAGGKAFASFTTKGGAKIAGKHVQHGGLLGKMTQTGNKYQAATEGFFKNNKFFQKFAGTKLGGKFVGAAGTAAHHTGRWSYFGSALRHGKYGGVAMDIVTQSYRNGALAISPWARRAAIGGYIGSQIIKNTGGYDANAYQVGNGFTTVLGDQVTINNAQYNFLGQSSSGTNIYADSNGNVVYQDKNGAMSTVTVKDSNGTYITANMNNVDEDSELSINGASLGQYSTFALSVDNTPTEDYDGYVAGVSEDVKKLQEHGLDEAVLQNATP